MIQLIKLIKPSKQAAAFIVLLLFVQTLGTLYIPTLMADIVNNGIVKGEVNHVLLTGVKMLLVAVGTGFAAISVTYLTSRFAAGLERGIRNALFQKVQRISVDDFNTIGTASMITRCTSDAAGVQQAAMMSLQMLLPVPVMIIGGLLLAFLKDPYMALIIGSTIGVFAVLVVVMSKKILPLFVRLQENMDNINARLREVISGVRVIRAFNRVGDEQSRLSQTFGAYAETAITVNKLFAVMMPLVMLVMNGTTLALIYFGGRRVAAGAMAIGDIMALVEYSILILFYLIMGVMVFIMLPKAQACAKRIMAVMNLPEESGIAATKSQAGAPNKAAKLALEAVDFRYVGAENDVLHHITFTANKGETIAIIGGTGCGKSTLVELLLGFYEPTAGEIRLDGVSTKDLPKTVLREKIAYVPQKALLFSGTIADNLRFGSENADTDALKRAADIAQASEFIANLPDGLEHQVAQGGVNFSGGQKQRLAIARALVKKADIYIFDDSFSALDYQTDANLRKALRGALTEAVVLIVAQRISTIIDADKIIVLDDGQIAGIGSHQQLMGTCPLYQQIAASQLQKEAPHE